MAYMQLGQLADPADRFCPFGAVAHFPYRYMGGDELGAKTVAERFYDGGKFKAHGWHIYYLRTLPDSGSKPILFIPKAEFESFLREINRLTGISAEFPNAIRCPGFDLDFDIDGIPRPRYLGYLCGTVSLAELQQHIPMEGSPLEQGLDLYERSMPAYRLKIQQSLDASRNTLRKAKEKKKKARVAQKERWCKQLRRTQCYLGVRPRVTVDPDDFEIDPNAMWEDAQKTQIAHEKSLGMHLPTLDVAKMAPYSFNMEVIFICVDIEVFERAHHKLTEVGISTFDTRDVSQIPPGFRGENWMKKIRSRHFRIVENKHLVNSEFVDGCPDKFVREFGTSEWIRAHEIPRAVSSCFRQPFSKPGMYQPYPISAEGVSRDGSKVEPLIDLSETEKRNVVLVGHEVSSDIRYLRRVGCNIETFSNLIEAVDTTDLYRAWKHETNSARLGVVLLDLELTGWHLHNAGNDAAYTLQALIGISVLAMDPSNQAPQELSSPKLQKAVKDAEDRLRDDNQEWLDADIEGDGGDPISMEQAELDDALLKSQKAHDRSDEKEAAKSAKDKGPKHFGQATKIGQPTASGQGDAMRQYQGNGWPENNRGNDNVRGRGRGGIDRGGRGTGRRGGRGSGRGRGQARGEAASVASLSNQVQSRFVIFDDEEWGM